MRTKSSHLRLFLLLNLCFFFFSSLITSFQSDELLFDDEEFGLEGARSSEDLDLTRSHPPPIQPVHSSGSRRRPSDQDLDSKVQFSLEHAFGDSEFSPAGTFTARVKTWPHGGQVPSLSLQCLVGAKNIYKNLQ